MERKLVELKRRRQQQVLEVKKEETVEQLKDEILGLQLALAEVTILLAGGEA